MPYPYATDDHQTANARAVAEAGGGWLMPQETLTPEALAARLEDLFARPASWPWQQRRRGLSGSTGRRRAWPIWCWR